MFYYELHLHTAQTSRCARSSAQDMAAQYARLGFDGIVVTDHFMNVQSHAQGVTPWRACVDAQLKGYRAAREAGEALGLRVFCGWEFTYLDNGEDYLTLGLSPAFLYDNEGCNTWDIARYADAVRAAGGILIRAHPYRTAWYIHTPCVEREGIADAMEVYNGGNGTEDENQRALDYALAHRLPMTAGSDAHSVADAARGYIGLTERPASYAALCDAIRQGRAAVFRKE